MDHTKEWPYLAYRDIAALDPADDFTYLCAIRHRRFADETLCRKPVLEVRRIAGRPCTI